ncbi:MULTISPECIES: DUF6460 domain-containing protein [Iodidimonas]|jgi:hypothetical protein|uniref:DUF6460 domain-containing protein n=1 Tax=Iodidimonas nitroreducens TaxID=1236968 RepID=A0A5A7N3S3_9PROT|nr:MULTISPECIES: DUF6460 domain-containing protein [Iodidimonas]GAK34909.1 hypothetical protein AQ1_02818 [alpha proteobacterium Q-1]GER02345.1 hypothetical protein JCM17846_00270 [Iodidimonas nitroreducens]
MKSITMKQVLGLVLASLLVGLFLKVAGLSPMEFWQSLWNRLSAMALWSWQSVDGLLIYVLMGAAIVVPLYILMRVLGKRRG